MERMRMDVCDLERTDIILDMLQLQTHNPKINQETREVKMTRCPLIYKRSIVAKKETEKRKKVEGKIRAIGKLERDEQKMLIKEKFDNKVKLDREKVRKMVSQKFHKQLKVFKKVELERMSVRKPQDYAINLRKDFVPRKERIYLISREEKEKVREFVEEQLKKEYIRPSKSPQTSPVFFVGKKDKKRRMVQVY